MDRFQHQIKRIRNKSFSFQTLLQPCPKGVFHGMWEGYPSDFVTNNYGSSSPGAHFVKNHESELKKQRIRN